MAVYRLNSCGCFDGRFTRRKFLASSAVLALSISPAIGQQRWNFGLENVCSFFPEDKVEADIYTFGSMQEASDVVQKITNAVGLSPNFQVLQANVPNAAAVIRSGQRFILYSQVFISEITQAAATEWASWTIMAHEVGHHLNGHTLGDVGSRPPLELEADRFAGHVVKRMGGTLQQALSPYQQMSAAGSPTHPPKSARLEAVTKGWTEAQGTTQPGPTLTAAPAEVLRQVIEQLRAGTPPYARMSPQLANVVHQQNAMVTPRLQGLGAITNIQQIQQQSGLNGATHYEFAVAFQNGSTTWQMGLLLNGTITALYFQ